MVHNNVLYDPLKPVYLAKTWFFSCSPKCSQSIRFQDFWSSISLEWISQYRSFLHGVSHEGKVTSQIINCGWVWPFVPHIQSDCRILRSSISLERIKLYLLVFACLVMFVFRWSSREGNIWDYHSCLTGAVCASCSMRLQDSLFNVSGKYQLKS